MRNRLLPALTATFIALYFIALTRDGLHSYFTPDDCMTMYRSVMNPASALWRANVLFFENSVFVRPMACVWYRLIYDFVGFSPVPYHCANLVTLAANVLLTYCVARRLSGSRETGALAALLIAYHGRFFSLYYNTSFVYDIICYFFYFSALLFYLRMRARESAARWWELGILGALYICAMNAKELAVTFPGIVAVYELLYHRCDFGRFSLRDLLRWAKTSGRGFFVTSFLTLMLVAGRASTPGLLKNPAFQPEFTGSHFMMTSRNFVSEIFFQHGQLSSGAVLTIWAVMLGVAWFSRSRALRFAWLFVMLSVIPVAFIPPRSPGQYYIPFFGWVFFFAVAAAEGSRWLFQRMIRRRAASWQLARAVVVFLAIAGFMASMRRPWSEEVSVSLEAEQYRNMTAQLHAMHPSFKPGARLLFIADPIEDEYQLLMLLRLSYGQEDLVVDRSRFLSEPLTAERMATYDDVIYYRGGRFLESREAPEEEPSVVIDWGKVAVYHEDWSPVDAAHPARAGEHVMSKMTNLGATEPAVEPGQKFPKQPFAEISTPLAVRVGGIEAEVGLKIGWPEQVNQYRVDFVIPAGVGTGNVDVVVTSGGRSGTGMGIVVK